MARAKKEAALTPEERLQAALVPDWEWPYKLPENWCWVYAPHIFDIGYGKGLPTKQLSDTGYPVFGANGQIGFYSEYMYKEPQALMSCRGAYSGTMNKSLPYSYVTSNSLIISSPRGLMGTDCIYYLFSALNVSELISGTAQPQVTVQAFDGFPIPLSPLAEQQRIVDRIESLFTKLDEAKEKAQAVVDSFETRKAAILHKAFTGELTAKWREEHGVRMESWRWIPLKKSGSWYGGGTPSMSRSEYWENGTLLWVTAKDMKSDLIEDTLMHTNMFGVENSSANYIAQPAVLFVMRSGILRRTFPVCMVKKPFTVNQDIKALVPTDNIDLEYLFWGCKANEKRILESCMKNGTTVESINSAALRDFEIPIAGSNEQIEIVRILDAFFAKEQQAKEAAEKVLDQIKLMKKSILARAFRGELGTNDPNEESAVELLKEIIRRG